MSQDQTGYKVMNTFIQLNVIFNQSEFKVNMKRDGGEGDDGLGRYICG